MRMSRRSPHYLQIMLFIWHFEIMWTFADQLGEVHVSLENYIKTKLYDPGSQILIDGVPQEKESSIATLFLFLILIRWGRQSVHALSTTWKSQQSSPAPSIFVSCSFRCSSRHWRSGVRPCAGRSRLPVSAGPQGGPPQPPFRPPGRRSCPRPPQYAYGGR